MAASGSHTYEPFENHRGAGKGSEIGYPGVYSGNIALEEMSNFHVNGQEERVQAPGPQVNLDNLDSLMPAPVVIQPQIFTANMLDPLSKSVHSQLSTKHMSSESLMRVIQQGGNQLQRTVNGQFVSLKGNMSYKELLVGLMFEGENFQAYNQFSHLTYTHLTYADENNATLSGKTGGICLITNQRLLLLSSQQDMSMGLVEWGNPKRLPGGYNLTANCGDKTYYQPIPLRCLKSVEMQGNTGVSGTIAVHGVAPCCGGFCGLCGLTCCPDTDALKSWQAQPVTRSQTNEMIITLGVLMPPWDKKMFLHMYVNENVPVAVVRDFVSLLQRNAPGLK